MATAILLYNKVKLDDGSEGVVRYIGGIMGKKGVFYGVDITKGDAKNNGTFKGVEYFKTKKGTKTGRFVPESKIAKSTKTTFSKYPFKLNETVLCKKTNCKGIIKYIGVPSWVKGGKVYYGLELKKKKGTCNGTNKGIAYFTTKSQYGIYVPSKEVKKLNKKKKDKKDDDDEKDVKDVMRDYYKSKPTTKVPKTIKKPKNKNKNKKSIASSASNSSDGSYSLDPELNKYEQPPVRLSPSPKPQNLSQSSSKKISVDYMDEEKDGVDFEQYTAKNEEIDYKKKEFERKRKIEYMKQLEREDRLNRERNKKLEIEHREKLKKEKELKKQQRIEQKAVEKQQQLTRKQKELKDMERLQKYRDAKLKQEQIQNEQMKEEQDNESHDIQRTLNDIKKYKELEEMKKKRQQEEQEREQERLLAAKLRAQKEAKLNQSKQPTPKQETTTYEDEEDDDGKQAQPNSNMNMMNGNGVKRTYTNREINDEMSGIGKDIKNVKMIYLDKYNGSIPLILHMFETKLSAINKYDEFGLFHPEQMMLNKNKPAVMFANNIYVYFTSLPTPLLHTVDQNILNKAINKDVMKSVTDEMSSPYNTVLVWLWDILAKVAQHKSSNGGMSEQQLGKVFGPLVTMFTKADAKGNRVSTNVLAASRMMQFFRRGIQWRMECQGIKLDDD